MRYFLIATAAALVGCSEAERANLADEVDTNAALARADESLANFNSGAPADAGSATVAPGQWFTRTEAGNRWAGYGPPDSEATFSVRCEGDRLIFSTTEVPRSGPGATQMQVSADGVDQTLAAVTNEQGLPNTEASVDASADWLRRLRAVSGNVTVSVAGGEALAVPISEPLTSLIRDCRR